MGALRNLFGPSQQEVWGQLAQEIDAELDHGFWKGTAVRARVGEWTVTLDTYTVSTGQSSVTYTRMRAPYFNPDGFRFALSPEGFFASIGKFFGMQDIEIGYPEFDESYIIKGNDQEKLRWLFSNARVRELIRRQPRIRLEIKDDEGWFGADFPDGVDQLCFHATGIIKDVEQLKALFDLFGEVLNQLCKIGSAYEGDPNVAL